MHWPPALDMMQAGLWNAETVTHGTNIVMTHAQKGCLSINVQLHSIRYYLQIHPAGLALNTVGSGHKPALG